MQTFFAASIGIILTAFLLGMTWKWVVKPLLNLPVKGIKHTLSKSFLMGVSVGNKLATLAPKKVIESEGEVTAEAAFMDQFETPNYEIADWVSCHHIKKCGYVYFRGYANHLERRFIVEGNLAFLKKHGKRIQLSSIKGKYSSDDSSFIEQTVEEVTKLISESVSKIEKPATVRVKAKAKVVDEIEEILTDVVTAPSQEQSELPVTMNENAVEVVPTHEKPVTPVAKKEKALETYKGYLISFGKATRHISGSKDNSEEPGAEDAGREIMQFRVVIRGEDGIEESVWGQDLSRALNDANILVNDMVEVIKLGKRQFGKTWKNLYTINKLA